MMLDVETGMRSTSDTNHEKFGQKAEWELRVGLWKMKHKNNSKLLAVAD